jgi:hypothetical protein
MSRRALIVVAAVVVAVAVVAGLVVFWPSDDGPESSDQATPSATGTPSPTASGPPRAPLTGLPVDDPAALDHPAVAVKVSDVPAAHPQVGIDDADIVFSEPLGPAYTRLAAVFHSTLPETVGPVRSVRPVDAALLGPMAPVFANAMGAEWVLDYVDDVADVDNLGTLRVSGSGAYELDASRPVPDHVFVHPEILLGLSERTAPPEPYFSYAETPEESTPVRAGTPADSVRIPYGPSWDVTWEFDAPSGRYLRSQPWGPHVTVEDVQVGATNVLVLEVESEVGKIGDGAGGPVALVDLVDASGPFTALTGGRSVAGTWTKAGVNDPFTFRTAAGQELELAPGNTWVELPEAAPEITRR